jgi:hypothetical protein
MTVTLNKFQPFIENLAEKKINLGGTGLTLALVSSANPPVTANGILSQLVQAVYDYCSTRVCTVTSSAQISGVYKLVLADLVLTASGGNVGPFRYVVLYDDSALSDELVGWYDYGYDISLADGETIAVDFDGVNGVLQLT